MIYKPYGSVKKTYKDFCILDENKTNKKLNFYFFKKKFFVYKRLKNELKSIKISKKKKHLCWYGNSFNLKNFVNIFKKKNRIKNTIFYRRFSFIRFKKKFKKINQDNRVYFNRLLGFDLPKRKLIFFFLKTKNIKKIDMCRFISRTNETKNILYILKGFFIKIKKNRVTNYKNIISVTSLFKYMESFEKNTSLNFNEGEGFYDFRQINFLYGFYNFISEKKRITFDYNIFYYRTYNWRLI